MKINPCNFGCGDFFVGENVKIVSTLTIFT